VLYAGGCPNTTAANKLTFGEQLRQFRLMKSLAIVDERIQFIGAVWHKPRFCLTEFPVESYNEPDTNDVLILQPIR
jgi:hypothetical protein